MKNKVLIIILIFFGLHFLQAQDLPIKVEPLTKDFYVHISYQLLGGSPFPSNGLIVKTSKGVLLVDTGWGEAATREVYKWVRKNLREKVKLCIVTHSHGDRASGTGWLQKKGVQVISTPLTAEKSAVQGYAKPEGTLSNDTTLIFNGLKVQTYFPGEGHTNDNIVVYFPEQQLLFGGCFVKSYVAFGMGNIADANMEAWADSVENMMRKFPNMKFVIPGHQAWDDGASLLHTIELIKKANAKVIGG